MRHQTRRVDIGKRLKLRRIEMDLKQSELAEITGLSRETIGRIERGALDSSRATLKVLESVLGIGLADRGNDQ